MTVPRLDAIFYGVALSFLLARHHIIHTYRVALLVAGSVGLLSLFLFQHQCSQTNNLVPFYRAAFVVLPLCFSLTLPSFASLERLPKRFAVLTAPITNLSLWSYSIYLSHIYILFAVYTAFGPTREHPLINLLSKVVGLAACLVVSKLIYTYFESKLMALRPSEQPALR
jgi:peptidoglycan/LPS O-acetylase OafA/YrhL